MRFATSASDGKRHTRRRVEGASMATGVVEALASAGGTTLVTDINGSQEAADAIKPGTMVPTEVADPFATGQGTRRQSFSAWAAFLRLHYRSYNSTSNMRGNVSVQGRNSACRTITMRSAELMRLTSSSVTTPKKTHETD